LPDVSSPSIFPIFLLRHLGWKFFVALDGREGGSRGWIKAAGWLPHSRGGGVIPGWRKSIEGFAPKEHRGVISERGSVIQRCAGKMGRRVPGIKTKLLQLASKTGSRLLPVLTLRYAAEEVGDQLEPAKKGNHRKQ